MHIPHSLIQQKDALCIRDVIAHSWAPATRATYGLGLVLFHDFCDRRGIPERWRAPASAELLEAFSATTAGSYAVTTLSNAIASIRAWHIAHRLPWWIEENGMKTLLQAAKTLAPASSKRKQRSPCTIDYLLAILPHLDLSAPKDAAVWACATSAFWSLARLGELAVPLVLAFNPKRHVHASCVQHTRFNDEYFTNVTSIFIPFTKVDQHKGENVMWAKQDGPPTQRQPSKTTYTSTSPLVKTTYSRTLLMASASPSPLPLSPTAGRPQPR
ncbi:hypothetical protein K474DRAFT_1679268 [Panus rudis PR-1116 ss-1]|nr:hypothetical protein K474DRAFT_1679268 [Panus rudis PR-1116 ss-1]